jgi:hypothetical protein
MTSFAGKGNALLGVVAAFSLAGVLIALGFALGTLYGLYRDAETPKGSNAGAKHTQQDAPKLGRSEMREEQSATKKANLNWTILGSAQNDSGQQSQTNIASQGANNQSRESTIPAQEYSEHRSAAQRAEENSLIAQPEVHRQSSPSLPKSGPQIEDSPRPRDNPIAEARRRVRESVEKVRRADAAVREYIAQPEFLDDLSPRVRLELEIGMRCRERHRDDSLQDACERNERKGWEQMQGHFGMPRRIAADAKVRCLESHQSFSLQAACMRNEQKGLAELQGDFGMPPSVANKAKSYCADRHSSFALQAACVRNYRRQLKGARGD